MKCVVPNQNVKIISRAIHSLARIGDEMFVEPTENDLFFRTVNMSQSAFAEFRMGRSFFSSFLSDQNEEKEMKFKITMKSCLSVFKSLHSMDKQVENCEIRMKPGGTVIVFQIKFSNSSVRKHFLPIIDSETVEASFGQDNSNILVASSKFLSSCLKHFNQSEDEITITVNEEKLLIKNHLELSRDCNSMRTELCFGPAVFEQYTVGSPTKITFCLREFRAVLLLAEPANLPVSMAFTSPGSPVILNVSNNPAYEANYIVSTLNLREMSGSFSGRSSVSGDNRIRQLLSGQSLAGGSETPAEEDAFSFRSQDPADLPQRLFEPSNSRYQPPNAVPSNVRPEDTPDSSQLSNSTVDNVNEPVVVEESRPGSEENLLPSHVSHLVKTVFARCFQSVNTLDLLPGNDLVLAENTQNLAETEACLKNV